MTGRGRSTLCGHLSLPIWARHASTSFIVPSFSIATGMNMWEEEKAEYLFGCLSLRRHLSRAASYCGDGGQVRCGQSIDYCCVPCQPTTSLPQIWGSGCSSKPRISPVSSLTAETSSCRRAFQMISFSCWWRIERPALRLQDSPCSPLDDIAAWTRVRFTQGESKS